MRQAVIYLRVSTIEQTTANQERELREIAGRLWIGREGGLRAAGFWASRGRHPSLTSNGGLHATTAGGDQFGWQCVGG